MTNVYVTIGQTLLYPTSGSSLEVERPRWLVVTLVAVHQAPVGRASLPPSRFAGHGGGRDSPGRQERAAGYRPQYAVGRHPFTLGGQGSPRPSLPPTQQLLLSHALFDMHRTQNAHTRRPRRAAQTTHPATRGDSHGRKSRIFDHTVHGGPRLVLFPLSTFRGGASFTFGHALAKCSCDSNGRSANGWSVRPPPGQPIRCKCGPAVNRPVSPSGPICARRPWDQWCGKGESIAGEKTTWGR